MEEKQKTEMRADAPTSTTYQSVEVLTPDGRRVYNLSLTTPDAALFVRIMNILTEN